MLTRAALQCHGLNSNFYRLSSNLIKNHHQILIAKSSLNSIKQFSFSASSLGYNKRLLEARSKLSKYPETLSCSDPVGGCQHNRFDISSSRNCYNGKDKSKQQSNNPQSDPCHRAFQPTCPPLEGLSGAKGGIPSGSSGGTGGESGDGGGNKWTKWLLAAIAVAGCGGIIYLLTSKSSEDKSDEGVSRSAALGSGLRTKIPASSKDIPKKVPYLLIGGGTASFSAFRAIKSLDPKAKVLVISNEFHKPYMRPPLSKELWFHGEINVIPENYKFKQWNGATRSLYYEPDEFYIEPTKLMDNPNGGVAVCQGYEVKKIDFFKNEAILTDGTVIEYDQCLIATGCEPKSLDVFESSSRNVKERISKYRTPEDFENLKNLIEQKKSFVIIGSSFLSSELSCALAKYVNKIEQPVKIYQIFHENGNIANSLPEYLSKWTTKKIQEQGVCVIPNASVLNANMMHNHLKLDLSNGKSILTDHVVLCLGNEPNTELGKASGLNIDKNLGGYIVNSEMEAKSHLYVAGDAASFEDPLLGRRRIESHDHAVISGRLAGENMTGQKKSYSHQAMFWSDLGPSIGFEGIGLIDSSLPTVGVFAKMSQEELSKIRQMSFKDNGDAVEEVITSKTTTTSSESSESSSDNQNITAPEKTIKKSNENDDNYEKGVIFYLRDEKIVGILLWNLFNRINIARKVIKENRKFDDLNEVAKLFEIHS